MTDQTQSLLLIEDNPGDAFYIQELLKFLPTKYFDVQLAARLAEALEIARQTPPDIVLLDMNLPDSYGLETLARLVEALPRTPMVILTGNEDERQAIEALQQGAQDYLMKGQVNSELLVRSLRFALERKNVEDALLDATKLRVELDREKLLREAKERFIELVSHEFRTPLTAIITSASLMESYGDEIPSEKRGSHISKILGSAARINELLDSILSMSLVQSSEVDVVASHINLKDFLQTFVEDFKETHKVPHHIQVIAQGDNQKGWIDRRLVGQILTHLISNAVKYSAPPSLIVIQLESREQEAFIRVMDEGIGISAEDQENIFTLLYRGQKTPYIPGLGVGLNIANHAAMLHGGNITLHSELGRGTTFVVWLPYLTPPPKRRNDATSD